MGLEVKPVWPALALGLVVRLMLMVYGLWQDSTMAVKYTDVDYFVFTDAARYITQGQSPYKRATYRYSPLLAWALQPNILWSEHFGKLLFITCDVLTGYLMYRVVRMRSGTPKMAAFCAELWLLNPMPMAVSSRGNAESVLSVIVLGALYCVMHPSRVGPTLGAILFASAVHLKIYPITYALAIYLFLDDDKRGESDSRSQKFRGLLGLDVWPNSTRMIFVAATAFTFFALTGVCYSWYGMEFLQETYLYHVTRRDTRHNFSPYFYMLYLSAESDFNLTLGLLAFIPQVALLVLASVKFYKDLPFSCFLQTFIFVTFNKVCTSQYFLWYLSLLPLIIPHLYMSVREAAFLVVLWFVGQGLWLAPAYYLEFEGYNTFRFLWIASLLFMAINVWILHRITACYHLRPIYSRKGALLSLNQRQAPSLGDYICRLVRRKNESRRPHKLKSK